MTEQDMAILLVRNGINKQKSQPDEYTEANEDDGVKALGNAAIANLLEFLGKHKIVADVQPTFATVVSGLLTALALNLLKNCRMMISSLAESRLCLRHRLVRQLRPSQNSLRIARRQISMLCIGMIYLRV